MLPSWQVSGRTFQQTNPFGSNGRDSNSTEGQVRRTIRSRVNERLVVRQ